MTDKHKKEQIILVVLGVVFLIMLPGILFKKNMQAGPGGAKDSLRIDISPLGGQAAISQAPEEDWQAAGKKTAYTTDKFRNPFFMPKDIYDSMLQLENAKAIEQPAQNAPGEDLPGMYITGIVWGKDNFDSMVFIGEGVYKIGDVVSEAKILAIDKNGVRFYYKDKEVLMKVKKP